MINTQKQGEKTMEKTIIEQATERYNSNPTPELDRAIRNFQEKAGEYEEVCSGYGAEYTAEDCDTAERYRDEAEEELKSML